MRNTTADHLLRLAEADPRIWLLTGDLGFSVLEPFAKRIPERFINVGVAEQNMVGVAAGLALSGCKVFCWSIVNFAITRCLEQIRNDVADHRADVTMIGIGGGFAYGSHGYSHHGIEDIAFTRVLPGMTVVVPADPMESAWALDAIACRGGPAYLRLHRGGEPELHDEPLQHRSFGDLLPLLDGQDVMFLASGPIAGEALAAAELLRSEGISTGVTSVPVIRPLDEAGIRDLAHRVLLLVTIEEHSTTGGLGSAVAEVVSAIPMPRARLLRTGIGQDLQLVGSQDFLRHRHGMDRDSLAELVRASLSAL